MESWERKKMGDRIRAVRVRRGLTQKELAESAGLGESALRSYELGDRFPKERHIEAISRTLKVRPEVFTSHSIDTLDDAIHVLFDLERPFGLVPEGEGRSGVTAEPMKRALRKALRDWGSEHDRLAAGEITREEYEDWKDTYTPTVFRSAISGKEIDDPFTGRRLPEDDRDGAVNVTWESDTLRALFDDADKWHAEHKDEFK